MFSPALFGFAQKAASAVGLQQDGAPIPSPLVGPAEKAQDIYKYMYRTIHRSNVSSGNFALSSIRYSLPFSLTWICQAKTIEAWLLQGRPKAPS